MNQAFVEKIDGIAHLNGKSHDEVMGLWKNYAKTCEGFDQSPLLWEFCNWHKFKGGII